MSTSLPSLKDKLKKQIKKKKLSVKKKKENQKERHHWQLGITRRVMIGGEMLSKV